MNGVASAHREEQVQRSGKYGPREPAGQQHRGQRLEWAEREGEAWGQRGDGETQPSGPHKPLEGLWAFTPSAVDAAEGF